MVKIFGVFNKKDGSDRLQRNIFTRLSRGISDPSMDLQTWQFNGAFLALSTSKYMNTENHFSCDEGGLILAGHTAERDPLDAKTLFSL